MKELRIGGFHEIALDDLEGKRVSLNLLTGEKATVLFFLSSDCPLCENYSVTINKLRKKYEAKDVTFIGLFSGKYVVGKKVERYLSEFNPAVTVLLDKEYKMMNLLEAQVTPEVFAFDQKYHLQHKCIVAL